MKKEKLQNRLGRLYNTKLDIDDPRGKLFAICKKHYEELEPLWTKNGLIFLEEGKTNKPCKNC